MKMRIADLRSHISDKREHAYLERLFLTIAIMRTITNTNSGSHRVSIFGTVVMPLWGRPETMKMAEYRSAAFARARRSPECSEALRDTPGAETGRYVDCARRGDRAAFLQGGTGTVFRSTKPPRKTVPVASEHIGRGHVSPLGGGCNFFFFDDSRGVIRSKPS